MKNMQQLELDLALPIPPQRHHRAIERRTDPMFLRDQFEGVGKWGLPFVRRQDIDLEDLNLISCTNCINDEREYYDRGVHFFVDDYNFEDIYLSPEKTFSLYSQYRFCCTPDFSVYPEMRMWRQFESVAHSRWCGAWWQAHGMKVVPTVTWDGYSSFEFCFEGIEQGCIVAIATYACHGNEAAYMRGFRAMCERINPSAVICYGEPFPNMPNNVIPIPACPPRCLHREIRKRNRRLMA